MKLACEEIVDFLAIDPPPELILKHKPTARARKRVAELIEHSRDGTLSSDERDELDNTVQLEHILRIAKAKAAIGLRDK